VECSVSGALASGAFGGCGVRAGCGAFIIAFLAPQRAPFRRAARGIRGRARWGPPACLQKAPGCRRQACRGKPPFDRVRAGAWSLEPYSGARWEPGTGRIFYEDRLQRARRWRLAASGYTSPAKSQSRPSSESGWGSRQRWRLPVATGYGRRTGKLGPGQRTRR
jgi:hypothetical protein